MEPAFVALLVAAGIIGGVLSAMVGGASLVTFPVMLMTGMPPVNAAVSNLVASVPSNIVALLANRHAIPKLDRAFVGFSAASLIGALIGAALLLVTSQQVFALLVPLLIGFATLLFALSERIGAWIRARAAARGRPEPRLDAGAIPLMLPVSIYGGYFGAGVGVLALAVLSLGTDGDYRTANTIKNLVMSVNVVAAALLLAFSGEVNWPPTLVMMIGSVFGGYLGGHLSQVAPQAVMRWIVIVVGTLLTLAFVWRYWL